MHVKLTQRQRIIVAIVYIGLLLILFAIIDGNFGELLWEPSNDKRIWFISGALLVILGKYIAEPFFSKPTDAIANSTAVLITLIAITDKDGFALYEIVFWISITVLFCSILTIFLKNVEDENWNKVNNFAYRFSTNIGNSKILFSLIYVTSIYSYFLKVDSPDVVSFVVLSLFWICLIFFDIIGKTVELIAKLIGKEEKIEDELGTAIGCENPLLYNVEIDYLKHKNSNVELGDLVTIENEKLSKSIGIIINNKQLLNKVWLEIYLLTDQDGKTLRISQNHRLAYNSSKSILQSLNTVSKIKSIDSLPESLRHRVRNCGLYSNRQNFVGYIEKGSNINKIIFQHLGNNEIREGEIVTSSIYREETLFQLMDGLTNEEPLESKDRYGYELAFARKLGFYDDDQNELKTRKWLPKIYEPVFSFANIDTSEEQLQDISNDSIGRLPGTNLRIPIKDYHSLVTHNTAILGILGIGKSRLTFEILKKSLDNTDVKIICIDITNQYQAELGNYINEEELIIDLSDADRRDLKRSNKDGDFDNPNSWGNENEYKEVLDKCIKEFYEGDGRVLILNPDWHNVSVAGSQYKITHKVELTAAQKTRIISERAFKYSYSQGETDEARCLLVYEEAHSLIPEWNSVANDGDKTAVNGTSKVILQGRKFGLGSLVVTQRTANISKSILNQCNTVFAMRVFDDTGKQFLENYIGSDYSNTLPTLEERHAIAIGKALKLKQPIIIQLNDMRYIVEAPQEPEEEQVDE